MRPWPRYVYGTPEKVREQLDAIAAELGIDEIMALCVVHDHKAREHSYELLAKAYGLKAPSNGPRE